MNAMIPMLIGCTPLVIHIIRSCAKRRKDEQAAAEKIAADIRAARCAEREKARREAERAAARAAKATERERLRVVSQTKKTVASIHKKLSASSSLANLHSALLDARSDFASIDYTYTNTSLDLEYDFIKDMLAHSDSEILNQYIQSRFDSICQEAIKPMSLDDFSHRMASLFSEIDKVSVSLPNETRTFVRKLRKEVGIL